MTRQGESGRCSREEMRRLLARYQFAALDEDERADFEAHLLDCDACFAELERGSRVAAATRARAPEYAALLRAGRPQSARPRGGLADRIRTRLRGMRGPWALLPAGAAILVVALGGYRWLSATANPARLATFPRESLAPTLVRGPGTPDPVGELMNAGAGYFDLQRYPEATRCFRGARARDPERADAAYLLGLTLALDGDAAAAVPELEAARRLAREEDLRMKSTWALANAYLKTGRIGEARDALRELLEDPGETGARARRLLARLRG